MLLCGTPNRCGELLAFSQRWQAALNNRRFSSSPLRFCRFSAAIKRTHGNRRSPSPHLSTRRFGFTRFRFFELGYFASFDHAPNDVIFVSRSLDLLFAMEAFCHRWIRLLPNELLAAFHGTALISRMGKVLDAFVVVAEIFWQQREYDMLWGCAVI